MAFSVNLAPRTGGRSHTATAASPRMVGVLFLIGFALFCAWDYSGYGHGYVAVALGSMQRSFQAFMYGLRVRV